MTDEKLVRDFIHACSAGHQGSIFSPPKCDVEEYKRCEGVIRRSNTSVKRRMVVLGAVHPVAGLLLFEVIPDSQVGYADIYQLTDSFNYADCIEVKNSAWRQDEPRFDGKAWDKWVIDDHLSRINWFSNDSIRSICMKHDLSCADLMRWAKNTIIWEDIPVMIENVDGHCFISLCP